MAKRAQKITLRTDRKARDCLPKDFASCVVILERYGDVLQIRKAKGDLPRRYSFKHLMAGVSKENLHTPIETARPFGREML